MAIDWWNISRDYVNKAYMDALGREADEGGREYWVQEIMNGRVNPNELIDRLRAQEITPTSLSLQDATYAAFLRGANLQESERESALASARDRYNRQLTQQAPMYADQRRQSTEAANTDWENRGLFRSGARLVDVNDRITQIDRQEAVWRQGIADDLADKESEVTRQIADIRRQKLEQETAARQRLTNRDASSAAMLLAAGGA